jgi:hypothetical protein
VGALQMKFSEYLKENESITIDPTCETFGDVLNARPNLKTAFKALAIKEKLDADTYRKFLALKINKELLIDKIQTKRKMLYNFLDINYGVIAHGIMTHGVYRLTVQNKIFVKLLSSIFTFNNEAFIEIDANQMEKDFMPMQHAALGNGLEYIAWGLYQ